MYETDRIPADWLVPATCLVDQIWVPSEFNRNTFAAAGVPETQLRVLHEAVDTHALFTPSLPLYSAGGGSGVEWQPSARIPEHADGRGGKEPVDRGDALGVGEGGGGAQMGSGAEHILQPCHGEDGRLRAWNATFRILSIFKWEHRKGWDVLLRAYWRAFSARDNVCLYLRTKMDAANTREFERLREDTRRALCGGAGSDGVGREREGGGGSGPVGAGGTCQLAPVVIIKKALPYSLLPALYRCVCLCFACLPMGWVGCVWGGLGAYYASIRGG